MLKRNKILGSIRVFKIVIFPFKDRLRELFKFWCLICRGNYTEDILVGLVNLAWGVEMVVNGIQRVKCGQIFDNNLKISPIRAIEISDGTTPDGELSFHTLFAKISPECLRGDLRTKTRRKMNKYQLFWDAKTQLSCPIVAILKIYKIYKGQCLYSSFLQETY